MSYYTRYYPNNSTYPADYLEWCFGEASNISEYTKAKQTELMYDAKAQQVAAAKEFYTAREAEEANMLEYWACEHEPVPACQVSTDRITELLGV